MGVGNGKLGLGWILREIGGWGINNQIFAKKKTFQEIKENEENCVF